MARRRGLALVIGLFAAAVGGMSGYTLWQRSRLELSGRVSERRQDCAGRKCTVRLRFGDPPGEWFVVSWADGFSDLGALAVGDQVDKRSGELGLRRNGQWQGWPFEGPVFIAMTVLGLLVASGLGIRALVRFARRTREW